MKKILFTLFVIGCIANTNAQVPSYVPTNGLVAYYPFNGNANDESGNGNNGTVDGGTNGTISYTFDRLGNNNAAILFESNPIWNSLGPFIELDNTENLLVNTDFTINYFVNISNSNLTGEIINKGPDNVSGNFISVALDNNSLENGVSQIGAVYETNFPNDIWKMVTIRNNEGFWEIYIDANRTASSQIGNITNNSNVYNLGAMPSGGSNGSFWPFQGMLDDIGFWNRPLTQQEITDLYDSNSSDECLTMTINTGVLSTNPVAYNSTVNIYPNPANDQITIDCGNLDNVEGWNIKITNMLGQEVFSQPMNTQQYVIPLNTWTGQGMYFVKIINAQNEVVNIKKIVLQ